MIGDLFSSSVTWFVLTGVVAVFLGLALFRALRLQEDYNRCEGVIQKHSKTFYKAFSALPGRKRRNAVYAIYAFCRIADDLVDDKKDAVGLDRLEEELGRLKEGDVPDHYMFRALHDTARRFYGTSYDFKPYFHMIEGQRMDLDHRGYGTLDDLLTYCYHVAGTVGRMLVPVLAPKDAHNLMTFADNLGHAMQVTNILRDVGEDLKVGRLYLPQDMMDKHGVTTDDLRHGRVTEGFKALFEELASVAETYYDGALEHLDLFPKDAQKPLGYAIILYRGIIEACRDSAYDVFNRRNHVDDATKKRLITAFQNRQKRRKP